MGFESKEGRGSSFWFSVALPQVEADVSPQSGPEPVVHELSGPLLVVDDLDQNRDIAPKMLRLRDIPWTWRPLERWRWRRFRRPATPSS